MDFCYGHSWDVGVSSLIVWAAGAFPSKDTLWTSTNGKFAVRPRPLIGLCFDMRTPENTTRHRCSMQASAGTGVASHWLALFCRRLHNRCRAAIGRRTTRSRPSRCTS